MARSADDARRRQLLMLLLLAVVLALAWDRALRPRADFHGSRPIEIAVVAFLSPSIEASPELIAFNRSEDTGLGFPAIERWLRDEFRRLTGEEAAPLEISIHGPFQEAMSPPELFSAQASTPSEQVLRAMNYQQYWRTRAREFGVNFDRADLRVVLVVLPDDAAADIAARSVGSAETRTAIVYLGESDLTAAYGTLTVLHELAHCLGAADGYDERFLAAWPRGYAEPRARPVFPQRYAELMAVDRPLSPDSEVEVRSLTEVRVGVQTAAEMGWVPASAAEREYSGLPTVPRVD